MGRRPKLNGPPAHVAQLHGCLCMAVLRENLSAQQSCYKEKNVDDTKVTFGSLPLLATTDSSLVVCGNCNIKP